MNSVLQQLYMMPSFRKGILEVQANNTEANALYCLRWIFGNLRDGRKTYFDASVLCKHIKDFDGRTLSIYEQKDADEFFNLLMDRLEYNLKNTDRPELTKDVFGGAFANDVICEDCPHRSTVKEEFLALNLQIHNKKNIAEGLNSYIEGEKLSGSNAYHCAKCDKRVNAKKRVSFGVLPNVLVIALKRFEFDFHRK
jgi:ubiquitin carboxyl-terminal hydrolase 9/24